MDRQASFGLPVPMDGFTGYIEVADPIDACSPLSNAEPDDEHAILLISMGGPSICDFSDQVFNAQEKGFHAVIIYNNKDSKELRHMTGVNGGRVNIPSTFIQKQDGLSLEHMYTNKTRFVITISIRDTFYDYFTAWLQAAGVSFIAFIIIIICFFCYAMISCDFLRSICYKCKIKSADRIIQRQIKNLPIRRFKPEDYYDQCSVCLEDFVSRVKLRELPCGHVYHAKCIDPWLQRRLTCAVCKRQVIKGAKPQISEDEENPYGSEDSPLLRVRPENRPPLIP